MNGDEYWFTVRLTVFLVVVGVVLITGIICEYLTVRRK